MEDARPLVLALRHDRQLAVFGQQLLNQCVGTRRASPWPLATRLRRGPGMSAPRRGGITICRPSRCTRSMRRCPQLAHSAAMVNARTVISGGMSVRPLISHHEAFAADAERGRNRTRSRRELDLAAEAIFEQRDRGRAKMPLDNLLGVHIEPDRRRGGEHQRWRARASQRRRRDVEPGGTDSDNSGIVRGPSRLKCNDHASVRFRTF